MTRKDHVVLVSGLHTQEYADAEIVLSYPSLAFLFSRKLAGKIEEWRPRLTFDVVVGAEHGGAYVGFLVAATYAHMTGSKARFVIARKQKSGRFIFDKADARFLRGKRALLVDDVVSEGTTFRRAGEALRRVGATVVAGAVWLNRSRYSNPKRLGVPALVALEQYPLRTWAPGECRRSGPCSKSVPINTTIGHGKEFLARQAAHKRP
ncbi:MAG TPA: phosphoribosyltransferase family protein [Candidatus Paceibacterota bacterium]